MHEFAREFTSRKVSPWGGLKLFQQVYAQSYMRDKLSELDLPYPGSNRGYDPLDIIEGFMTRVVLGSRRLLHRGMGRTDAVVHQESAEVGYHLVKKCRLSHSPLVPFCDELTMVVNAWMRSGDRFSSKNPLACIDEVVEYRALRAHRPNPGGGWLSFGQDPRRLSTQWA